MDSEALTNAIETIEKSFITIYLQAVVKYSNRIIDDNGAEKGHVCLTAICTISHIQLFSRPKGLATTMPLQVRSTKSISQHTTSSLRRLMLRLIQMQTKLKK